MESLSGNRRMVVLLTGVLLIGAVLAPPAAAIEDTHPPSQPTDPTWTDASGLLVESVSVGDPELHATWERSRDAVSGVVEYRVQLAETPDFAEVVVDRYTDSTETTTVFTEAHGVSHGHAYYFRVAGVDGVGHESEWSPPSNEVGVRENPDGPAIAHAPVMTAHYGQDIPIAVVATCDSESVQCVATLSYRATPFSEELLDDGTFGGGFTRVALDQGGTTALNGRDAIEWTGKIPGDVVTTTGVDYFIEVEDTYAISVFPGTPFAGSDLTTGVQGRGTYHHVHTVTPPLLQHAPPPFARSDTAVPLTLRAVCSTGSCDATLYYRTTTESIAATEEIVADNGELLATPDWPSVVMVDSGVSTDVGGAGEVVTYTAEIPADHVDTRGVDYFFHVTDGHTQAWLPGSTYQGYYAPLDGMRTGYYHVRVTETSHIVHAPPPAAPYREPIPVTAEANCPSSRTCEATLLYRTTTSSALENAPFEEAEMVQTRIDSVDGNDIVRLDAEIPAEVADTRGVDYFIRVTDGATTSWWPGLEPNDGYVFTDGVRVGYQHVRVLEPPHFVHVPHVTAPALEDLVVSTDLTCATEACSVDLTYVSGSEDPVAIPMERVAVREGTPAGRVEVWEATIPASDVTTRGLAYVMHASDGYTHTAAPGTFYWGAYVPVDGDDVSVAGQTVMFPVRVLEPPHPVHAPVVFSEPDQPIPIEVTANCATGACTGTLHWRVTGQPWQQAPMDAGPSLLGDLATDVWSFEGEIPAADVTTAGVDYRVDVSDGYVTESTPTWHTSVADA